MHLRILAMVLPLLAMPACAQQSSCPVPQSPRNLNTSQEKGVEYNFVSTKPLVTDTAEPETIKYKGQTLRRCDQHYHVPVENTQGIANERDGKPPKHGAPPPGQWVEIHTVYSVDPRTDGECKDRLDHNLQCCRGEPFVVRGFSARVVSGGQRTGKPIVPPTGNLFTAEWSGSNTSPDKTPGECKPVRAFWSFLMGDKFQVSQGELDTFAEGHGARQVQTGNRLSKDLTLVGADVSELDKKTCRWIDAGLIHNEDEAKRKCPDNCSTHAPLSRWNGLWQTPKPGERSQCSCCPAVRP